MVSTLQTEKLSQTNAQTTVICSVPQIHRIKTLRLKPRFSDSKFLLSAQKRKNNKKNLFFVTSEE